MSAEVKALLAAAEEAEERCRRYGKLAALLDRLTFALYISAFVAIAIGLATYLLYNTSQIVVAGLALWFAGYAAYILRDVYGEKATKAAEAACRYRRIAETIMEVCKLRAEIETQYETAVEKSAD
jgi:ABC-type uncharacterized transport system permease subunit